MNEARDGTRIAVARREHHRGRARIGELRAIQRVRKERNGIRCRISERADAMNDDARIAVELAAEFRRELA